MENEPITCRIYSYTFNNVNVRKEKFQLNNTFEMQASYLVPVCTVTTYGDRASGRRFRSTAGPIVVLTEIRHILFNILCFAKKVRIASYVVQLRVSYKCSVILTYCNIFFCSFTLSRTRQGRQIETGKLVLVVVCS